MKFIKNAFLLNFLLSELFEFRKNGEKKILEECNFPITGSRCVNMIITEKCVFEVDHKLGLLLTEVAEGLTVDDIKKATGCDFRVSENLKTMAQA